MAALDDSSVSNLKSMTSFTDFPLSTLNFFNKRDYGQFYHIANNANSPINTYLLGYFILSNLKINFATLPESDYNFPNTINSTFVADYKTYQATGDKLCWGSQS